MNSRKHYRDEYGLYARGESEEWDYEQHRSCTGDTLRGGVCTHLHDVDRSANVDADFMSK